MKRDKKKEPGLQYMLSLRINPAKSMSGVEDQLARATDRKTAIDLLTEIGERYIAAVFAADIVYPVEGFPQLFIGIHLFREVLRREISPVKKCLVELYRLFRFLRGGLFLRRGFR